MKKRFLTFTLAIFLIVCTPISLIADPNDGGIGDTRPRPPINFNSAPITFDVDCDGL